MTLGDDLGHRRLRHEERRLRLALQMLDSTKQRKLRLGEPVPAHYERTREDFGARLVAVQKLLGVPPG